MSEYTMENIKKGYEKRERITKELEKIRESLRLIRAECNYGQYPIEQSIININIAIKAQEIRN